MRADAIVDLKDSVARREKQRKSRRLQAVAETAAPVATGRWRQYGKPAAFLITAFLIVGWGLITGSALLARTFAIGQVQIRGELYNEQATQIESALSPYLQRDLLTVDLDQARAALLALGWVRQAQLRRQWPDTIVVSLEEFIPVARWNDNAFLSADGRVFELPYRVDVDHLPQLAGPDSHATEVLSRYAELQQLFSSSRLALVELQQDQRGSWTLKTREGVVIRLDGRDYAARVSRLLHVLDNNTALQLEQIAGIDLRHSNGFAVSWRGEPVAEHG